MSSLHIARYISRIPKRWLLVKGYCLGLIAYLIMIPHRKIVRRNLAFAYPDWDSKCIRHHTIAIFKNVFVTLLEILQAFFLDQQTILNSIRIKGDQNAIHLTKSRQVILVTGHIGNWEMANLFLSSYCKAPMITIARRLKPAFLDRLFYKMRSRYGTIIIDKMNSLAQIKRFIGKGYNLELLADQGTKISEGVEVSFFNRRVTATPVVAILARRYNCPVIPGCCIREADGNLSIVFYPPLPLKKTRNLRSDIRENTQLMMSAIEKAIREYPDQWFWFNKRWKRFYPWLYPEYQEKRRRKRAREEKQEMKRMKKSKKKAGR